ncbi:MAG TPA: squalene/phytoene synthase family protein [Ktedonobacterales bacterium]|nr:squalene/phytoene synthase family protein [Ktedonobacterales bacterium]
MLTRSHDVSCRRAASPARVYDGATLRAARQLRGTASALDESALTDDASLDAVYDYCREITREIARTFYYGSLFLPEAKRRAAWALYAFCRIADDIVDERDLYPNPQADLARWRGALLGAYAGQPRGPVMRAWADTLSRYPVPLRPALDLLDGVEMDLSGAAFATFEELRLYCYRVAGTVGLLMAPILGYRDEAALSAAVDLGIAMQLTNILRDLAEDAARGRLYLPTDELAAFGYTRAELEQGQITPAFVELMRFQIARAEEYYQHGLRGVRLLDDDAQLAIALSGYLYRAILGRIHMRSYDVFSERIHISTPGKLALLPSTWLRVRLGALR